MPNCAVCAARCVPDAAWCSQCFAPLGAVATVGATPIAVPALGRFVPAPEAAPTLGRPTRWRKTPTTFGPAGRILATLGLLVPLVFMVVGGLVFMAAWAGAVLWLAVVMPRGLRDIWRAGRLPGP